MTYFRDWGGHDTVKGKMRVLIFVHKDENTDNNQRNFSVEQFCEKRRNLHFSNANSHIRTVSKDQPSFSFKKVVFNKNTRAKNFVARRNLTTRYIVIYQSTFAFKEL